MFFNSLNFHVMKLHRISFFLIFYEVNLSSCNSGFVFKALSDLFSCFAASGFAGSDSEGDLCS